jgi:hypothetical protein
MIVKMKLAEILAFGMHESGVHFEPGLIERFNRETLHSPAAQAYKIFCMPPQTPLIKTAHQSL